MDFLLLWHQICKRLVMKNLLLLLAFAFTFSSSAQVKDSLVRSWHNKDYKIYHRATDSTYYIATQSGKKVYDSLKFVGFLSNSMQVIDADNNMFYLDDSLQKRTDTDNRSFVCGTVPHYELEIKRKGKNYEVTVDETFYDAGNQTPAEVMHEIPVKSADKLYFINKQQQYNYTDNYGIGSYAGAPPRTIIYEKDGKKGIWDTGKLYDEIIIDDNIIRYKDGSLWGFYPVNSEAQYQAADNFIFYLAPVTFKDGSKGWIDIKGKPYKKK